MSKATKCVTSPGWCPDLSMTSCLTSQQFLKSAIVLCITTTTVNPLNNIDPCQESTLSVGTSLLLISGLHFDRLGFEGSREFFEVEDMFYVILSSLPFRSLVAFSQTNRIARTLAQMIYTIRFRLRLIRYFQEHISDFTSKLLSTNAVIGGSTALSVIREHVHWTPLDLNVFVPHLKSVELIAFCENIGYSVVSQNVSWRYQSTTSAHFVLFRERDSKRITISESVDDSILPPILGSPTTAQMNFMTPHQVFCFYPDLSLDDFALRSVYHPNMNTVFSHVVRGITLMDDTKYWVMPCGYNCPRIWRRTCGGRGIEWYKWSSPQNEAQHNHFAGLSYKWRIGMHCESKCCPFSRRCGPRHI